MSRWRTKNGTRPFIPAFPAAWRHLPPVCILLRELIKKLQGKGVECLFVTLHVGLDTFRPVREEDPLKHVIHREYGVT